MKDLEDSSSSTAVSKKNNTAAYHGLGCIILAAKVLTAKYPEKENAIKQWVLEMLHLTGREEKQNVK